ncbi:insecticidal delta-endotoxin Cry8Ea1 family protein [Bacillus thuringiensis]|uniref:insecticidal delta-endotoxin Cry8Ea1 family protein n=1 Tax=Bacillus thuringiensis TaxID=1428 RepID=UPI0011A60189|nr:insecticidal delta-endotoxin Cry8Ea1 family protein [Bacillus thuringiensis]
MKYKDRKHAKRKYKQALLATVTTMTLGVSTLGSTASAFTEEKDKSATQQQNTGQQKNAGTYYEDKKLNPLAQFDTWTQDLGKATGAANYKTTLGMAEKLLPTIYKDLNSGNLNNTARSFVMLSTATIPYAGAFISPILGLIWPENGPNIKQMLEDMKKELCNIMDIKIEDYDLSTLGSSNRGMMKNIQELENSLNGTIPPLNKISEYVNEDVINAARVVNIQSDFNTLIEQAKKVNPNDQGTDFQLAELPLFTIMASAHLEFMQLVKQAAKSPKLNLTDAATANIIQNLPKDREDYKKHIEETYKRGENKINKKILTETNKINNIVMHARDTGMGASGISYDSTSGEINDKTKVEKVIKDLQGQLDELNNNKPHGNSSYQYELNKWDVKVRNIEEKLDHLKQSLSEYNKLLDQKKAYYNRTQGSEAFKIALTGKSANPNDVLQGGTWEQKGDKWFYIDANGVTKTGWLKDKGAWYYLSPDNNTENSAKEKFTTGEMMKKWVEIKDTKTDDKHWYYFNPKNGSMIQDIKAVLIDGKKYDFDSNGVCTNPNGN